MLVLNLVAMSNWGRFFFGHFVQKRTVPNWTFCRLFLFFYNKKRQHFCATSSTIKKQVIKMTIYLDVVIIENLIMNSIIMYATAIILKVQIKHIRILISSTIRSNLFSNDIYIKTSNIFKFIHKNHLINNHGVHSI